MPLATPSIKVDAVRRYGGNVILHGNSYDEAQEEAMRVSAQEGRTLIHPFDDMEVICGQATVGVEILKQVPTTHEPVHAIFACVGGGGLLAGISAYVKHVQPGVEMVGVEARDACAMTLSLEKGDRVTLDYVGLFADGAAVKVPGALTFAFCKSLVDKMITVSTDEICAAIKSGFNETRYGFGLIL